MSETGTLGRGPFGCKGREVPVALDGDWFLVGACGGDDMAGRGRWVWTSANQSFCSDINCALSQSSLNQCSCVGSHYMEGTGIS